MDRTGPFVLTLRNLEGGASHLELVGSGLDLDLAPSEVALQSPVALTATVFRAGEKVEVQGVLRATISCACDRCLEPVGLEIEIPLRVFAERRETRDRRSRQEVREEDLGIVYHDGQSVDLTDEVRQVLLCEVPWHVVCGDDCLGLCPRCGINRNSERCACLESGGHPGPSQTE